MGIELIDERVDGYVRGLLDLSEEQLRYAFKKALSTCRFFPQVAELRGFAAEYDRTTEAIIARDKRSRELDEKIAEPYKRRHLEGREPKMLPTILDLPEHSVAALQRHPDFKKALRHTTMATARQAAVPADVAERKGPEWEARVQQQALELKRRAVEQEKPQ